MKFRARGPRIGRDNSVRSPQTFNDIKIAEYYYGLHCGACAKVDPLVDKLNNNLFGARVTKYMMDQDYQYGGMHDPSLGSQQSKGERGSMRLGGVEVTPTIFWSDGMKTEGVPATTDGRFDTLQSSTYLCIRASECYIKHVRPDYTNEEVRSEVETVFDPDSHLLREEHHSNEASINPYKGLRQITSFYG